VGALTGIAAPTFPGGVFESWFVIGSPTVINPGIFTRVNQPINPFVR
jgi:hypothetical protein